MNIIVKYDRRSVDLCMNDTFERPKGPGAGATSHVDAAAASRRALDPRATSGREPSSVALSDRSRLAHTVARTRSSA